MRTTRSKALLLLFALPSCLHGSREAAVLAPLASQLAHGFSDGEAQPVYLIFADRLTATVFESLKRGGRYRIAPAGAPLVCPSTAAQGMQGYQLRVRVDTRMHDSAVVTMERSCRVSSQTISTGENILLVRVSGKWRIDKVISGFTVIPM